MKQLRYLEKIGLYKVTYSKTPNGTKTEDYEFLSEYSIQKQELNDQISASIYGSRIVNMLRISSIHHELEDLLRSKMNTEEDNISRYRIGYSGKMFRIVSVSFLSADIERI